MRRRVVHHLPSTCPLSARPPPPPPPPPPSSLAALRVSRNDARPQPKLAGVGQLHSLRLGAEGAGCGAGSAGRNRAGWRLGGARRWARWVGRRHLNPARAGGRTAPHPRPQRRRAGACSPPPPPSSSSCPPTAPLTRQHRAEDLLPPDAHVRLHVGEHCRGGRGRGRGGGGRPVGVGRHGPAHGGASIGCCAPAQLAQRPGWGLGPRPTSLSPSLSLIHLPRPHSHTPHPPQAAHPAAHPAAPPRPAPPPPVGSM